MAFLALSRLIGFGREAVIAYLFGAARTTDEYVAAVALPELAAGILLSGLLGFAIIPAFMRLQTAGRADKANRLLGAALGQVLVWSSAIALVGIFFAPLLISIVAPGLVGAARTDAATMLRIMSPSIVFFGLGSLGAAILNTRRSFLPVPLALIAANASSIAVLVILSHFVGIRAAAIAYLLAAAIGGVLQWLIASRRVPHLRINFRSRDPEVRVVLVSGAIAMVVTGAPYFRYLVERSMASTQSAGDLASLGFASRLVLFLAAVIAVPLGTIAFPSMAEHVARKDGAALQRLIRRSAGLALAVCVPATLALVLFAPAVVQLVFERGAFGRASTLLTASILSLYVLGLIPLAINEILVRALLAMEQKAAVLFILVGGLSVSIAVNLILLGSWGVRGLAVGASAGVWLSCILMIGMLGRVSRPATESSASH